MSKITWEKIDKSCESTPFIYAEIFDRDKYVGNIRLFRSLRASQVYGFGMICGSCGYCPTPDDNTVYIKTSGHGYNKASAALGEILESLKVRIKGHIIFNEEIPEKFRVGGNYYRIEAEDLEAINNGN